MGRRKGERGGKGVEREVRGRRECRREEEGGEGPGYFLELLWDP